MVVIAISGEPVSGNSTTAKLLAKRLKLRHWSAGEYVKGFGKSNRETGRAIDAMSSEMGQSKAFHETVDSKTIAEAKKGDVVIDGKLAIHFLKSIADLCVWLTCPLEERAKRNAQRDNISIDEGKQLAVEIEKIGRATYKRIYGFDYFNQKRIADIVIDTSKSNPEEVVAKILMILREKN